MPLPVPDQTTALAQLADATSRFASVVRTAGPTPNAIGVWSSLDVATHLSQTYVMYVDLVGGGTSPVTDHLNVSSVWERNVAEDPERDANALAERLEKAHASFVQGLEETGWTTEVNWHGGLRVPAWALVGILVLEAEVHGRDIALAEGSDWTIDRANAGLAMEALYPVLPAYLDKATASRLDATWELRLKGRDAVYVILKNGEIEITTEAPPTIDCRLSADPIEYLLVGFNRKSQWGPILTGKIVSWGRKPWLGLSFAKLFHPV